jgi:hypothetical protein
MNEYEAAHTIAMRWKLLASCAERREDRCRLSRISTSSSLPTAKLSQACSQPPDFTPKLTLKLKLTPKLTSTLTPWGSLQVQLGSA